MNEGTILREYVEQKRISKAQLAKDLEMTRGNLYQLFDSKTLTQETKSKFVAYFKKDIFSTYTPVQVQENGSYNGNDKIIELLERQIRLLEQHCSDKDRQIEELKLRNHALTIHVNESFASVHKAIENALAQVSSDTGEMKQHLNINSAYLKVLYQVTPLHRAKTEGKTVKELQEQTGKLYAEALSSLS